MVGGDPFVANPQRVGVIPPDRQYGDPQWVLPVALRIELPDERCAVRLCAQWSTPNAGKVENAVRATISGTSGAVSITDCRARAAGSGAPYGAVSVGESTWPLAGPNFRSVLHRGVTVGALVSV